MLRNAVVAHAVAAGATTPDEKVAPISLSVPQAAAPTPTLLDIDAAQDATVKVWGSDAELQVVAFDRRGVSYMRLNQDHMIRARLPRVGSLRSVVKHGSAEYLVWTTDFDRCGASNCAGKSMGLAPMPVPLTKIPDPRWVAAHPFGSPERSLAWQGARMWLAAAKFDGTAQLVEFDFPFEPTGNKEDLPRLEPVATKLGPARDLVVYTDNAGVLGALAVELDADGHWDLVQFRDGSGKQRLVRLPQTWNSGWVRTCVAQSEGGPETRYFVLGNGAQALVGYARDGVTTTWACWMLWSPLPRAATEIERSRWPAPPSAESRWRSSVETVR